MADVTTKDLDPPTPKGDASPSIQWLLVEARHARYAAQLKKDNREAYADYIVGLVFHLDGQPVRQPHGLSKKVVGQIVAAFEERFSGEGSKE